MSNAQRKKATTFSLKSYKDAAKKVADEKGPFVLEIDTDTSITIGRPDGNTLLAVEEARSSREVINLICGEHAKEIFELFGPEDYTALNQFGDDLREHFEIGL